MTITTITDAGQHLGSLHRGYQCGQCGQELAVFWVATPLGMLPQAATPDAQPVAFCPACGRQVDALTLFGPGACCAGS